MKASDENLNNIDLLLIVIFYSSPEESQAIHGNFCTRKCLGTSGLLYIHVLKPVHTTIFPSKQEKLIIAAPSFALSGLTRRLGLVRT
jgi:hypothetical protein